MTALVMEKLRQSRAGAVLNLPVKASAVIFQGGLLATLAGQAIAARAATSRAELETLRIVGMADASAIGGAADGLTRVQGSTGVFLLANSSSGDAITLADIGNECFAVDDQTVAKTNGGGVRAIAGRIVDVDTAGVWVEVGQAKGPRKVRLPFFINETDTLAGTSAELVSPVDGAITQLAVIVQKAVTTGGDVTASVGATPVAGLTCTVADGAAKGAIVTDTPTPGDATTVVAAGGRIQITPAAAFNIAGAISGFVEITF